MSDFNWCHGPKCHERHTVDRVRGVKGSKVLRTRKIKLNNWNRNNVWNWFCSQGCYADFMYKYSKKLLAIAPEDRVLLKHQSMTQIKNTYNRVNNGVL